MDALLDDTARHEIGGNNPPDPLFLEADERINNANRWLTERKEIADAEQADKAGGFRSQLSGTWKAIDERRLQENRDWAAAQKAKYDAPLDLLSRAITAIKAMSDAWLKKEDARIAEAKRQQEAAALKLRQEAEEAARKAKEDAERAGADVLRAQADADAKLKAAEDAAKLAAKPVERAAIKGDYTTRAITFRTYWSARVSDRAAMLKHYGKREEVRVAAADAALKLAIAEAKSLKDASKAPPGVIFFSEERS